MPIIVECEQQTDEWYKLRCGIPTSSCFSRILTTTGERSKSWQVYIDELTVESITGQASSFETWQMRLGSEQEPLAREQYELTHDVTVQQVGFIFHDERRLFGCSTDGLIGDSGILECKGGEGKTHVRRLRDHKRNPQLFVNEHFQQIQGELFITEREWCDLYGFFPGMWPVEIRVYRNDKWIKTLSQEIEIFCDELQKNILSVSAF